MTLIGCLESLRCQVLLDGEVRKLYDLVVALIDDGDETRACGYHRFFCIPWTPGCIKSGGCYLVELDCEDLRKFIDAKRANRYSETSKEPLSKFSFLLIDIQQCTAICFVQCLRQVIQNFWILIGKVRPCRPGRRPSGTTRPFERPL
jgi:hypothetical protein